jgi:hypothetical protein
MPGIFRRALLTVGAVIAAAGLEPACSAASIELLVPAYFNPADNPTDWQRMTASANKVSLTVILNPSNGPGARLDRSYSQPLSKLRKAGGRIIGYVSTRYGDRPLAQVFGDIDAHVRFYGVGGFFIDEMADADDLYLYRYYATIYRYMKQKNAGYRVIGNPGAQTRTQGGYFAHRAADALVIFENPLTSYPSFVPFPWTKNYPATTLGQIIFEVPGADLNATFQRARATRAGLLYITDPKGDPEDPYSAGLPSYWEALVSLVAKSR